MFSISRPRRLLAGVLAFAALGNAADYSSWSSYRPVILNTTGMSLSAPVTNIPILVRFSASGTNPQTDMLDAAETQVQADGSDIRVTKADGVTDVPFEIEHLSTGADGKLHIWILADNVDASSANAAGFRVYWGKTGQTSMSNGANVFSTTNGYQAVFHLNEAAGAVTDVANGYVGTAVGTATNTTQAISGASRDFTISNDGAADPTVTSNFIHFSPEATDPLSTHTGPITMEAWVRSSIGNFSNTSAGTKTIISHKNDSAEAVWLKRNNVTTGAGEQRYAAGGDTTNANGPAVPGGEGSKWHYVVGQWDGTAWTVIRQRTGEAWGTTGLPAPSMVRTVGGGAPVASTDPWFIGGWSDDGTTEGVITRGWRGQIDEVRISTVARDTNFLELSFETSQSSTTAITIGNTEVPPPPVAGPYENWPGHRNIVLNTSATGANVADTVLDFPVLVRLGTDELSIIGAANGGNSIRFSKADDATPLPYQIESWSATAAAIWVKVDTVYGNNATQYIRMHWGNAAAAPESNGAAVFDTANGYRAVYHMNGGTGTQENDATEMANHMAASDSVAGSVPGTVKGMIGSAREFAGDSTSPAGRQYFVAPGTAGKAELNWGPNNPHTITAWVYSRHFHKVYNQYGHGSSIFNKGDKQYALQAYGDTNNRLWEGAIYANQNNGWRQVKSRNKAQEGEWVYLATTWSGGPNNSNGTGKLYINGVLDSTIDLAIGTGTSGNNLPDFSYNLYIGANPTGGGTSAPAPGTTRDLADGTTSTPRFWNGYIDNITLSRGVRSAAFVRLSYENQKAENTLTDIGQPVYTAPGQPTGVTAVAGDAQATVTWVAPADNGGKPITGYKVEVSGNSALSCTTTGALTCTVTGLSNGTFYTFSVKAENEIGVGPASTASNQVVPAAPTTPTGPYSNWSGHRTITTNTKASGANIPANVYNFPVLVRLGSAESAILSAANGGNSIRFSKMDDSTALPYQIESWSSTAAAIWVKLDTVKGNDSVAAFRMHYGNANAADESSGPAVFDTTNGFVAVWHLNEASGNVADATGKGNAGTPSTTAPTHNPTSLIGGGKTFNGSTNWYQIGTDNTAMNLNTGTGALTISAWVNASACEPERIAAFSKYVNGDSPPGRQYALHTGNTTTNWRFTVGPPTGENEYFSESEATCVTGAWRHVVGTYNGSESPAPDSVRIYVDGVNVGSGGSAGVSGLGDSAFAYIGRIHNDQRYMNGSLDEITVSAVRRDSNWIKLSFESQKLMQRFTNIGVTAPSAPGAPTNLVATVSGTQQGSVVLSWSAPANNGGANISGYTVTGTPSGTCTTTGALTCSVTGLAAGSYSFTVTATNSAGTSPPSNTATATITSLALPGAFAIHMDGAHRPYTYRLPVNAVAITEKLTMTITDMQGKQVWTHTINPADSKVGELTWNGRTRKGQPVAPGMYIVRLRAEMDGQTLEAVRGSVKQ